MKCLVNRIPLRICVCSRNTQPYLQGQNITRLMRTRGVQNIRHTHALMNLEVDSTENTAGLSFQNSTHICVRGRSGQFDTHLCTWALWAIDFEIRVPNSMVSPLVRLWRNRKGDTIWFSEIDSCRKWQHFHWHALPNWYARCNMLQHTTTHYNTL